MDLLWEGAFQKDAFQNDSFQVEQAVEVPNAPGKWESTGHLILGGISSIQGGVTNKTKPWKQETVEDILEEFGLTREEFLSIMEVMLV